MIPADSALERHWKRSCWVLGVWSQANSNNINYPPLSGHGWKQVNADTLEIDWDSEDNLTEVRTRVNCIYQKRLWMQNGMSDQSLQV